MAMHSCRIIIVLLIFVTLGCSKEDKCVDLLEFPCYSDINILESRIEGTYDGKDVCIYQGVGNYTERTLRTSSYSTDPLGNNPSSGFYCGVLDWTPLNGSYTAPTIYLRTPYLYDTVNADLTYFEQINERIQFVNSKESWKVGKDDDNKNEEYLSLKIHFPCNSTIEPRGTHGEYLQTSNEQLTSNDYIKIEQFNMEEAHGEISYDIILDINVSLYKGVCFRSDCKRGRFNVKWRSIFTIPTK